MLPGFGHHHHQRVRYAYAVEGQELKYVIKVSRIGQAGAANGVDLIQLFRGKLAGLANKTLFGLPPINVALDGVDLAVVRDHPEGLRQLPLRDGIRREATVDQRDGRLEIDVLEIAVVAGQLPGSQLPFVDNGFVAEACYVELVTRLRVSIVDIVRGKFSQNVKPTLQGIRGHRLAGRHEDLLEPGLYTAAGGAYFFVVRRHFTIVKQVKAHLIGIILE